MLSLWHTIWKNMHKVSWTTGVFTQNEFLTHMQGQVGYPGTLAPLDHLGPIWWALAAAHCVYLHLSPGVVNHVNHITQDERWTGLGESWIKMKTQTDFHIILSPFVGQVLHHYPNPSIPSFNKKSTGSKLLMQIFKSWLRGTTSPRWKNPPKVLLSSSSSPLDLSGLTPRLFRMVEMKMWGLEDVSHPCFRTHRRSGLFQKKMRDVEFQESPNLTCFFLSARSFASKFLTCLTGYMCGEYIVTIRWAKEHSAKQSTINPFEKSLNPNHTFMIWGERPLLMRIQILSRFTANKVLLCQERQHVYVNLDVEATCVVPIDSNWMSMTNDGYGNTYVTWVIKDSFQSLQNLKSLPTRPPNDCSQPNPKCLITGSHIHLAWQIYRLISPHLKKSGLIGGLWWLMIP